MGKQKKSLSQLSFWIPFAGRNPKRVGTRIEVDLDGNIWSVSRNPEHKKRGDTVHKNSGQGLQSLFEEVSSAALGYSEGELIAFQVMHEFLLSHQGRQRENAA